MGSVFFKNCTHWQLVVSGKKTTLPASFSGHCGAARATPGKAEVEATNTSIKQTNDAKFFIFNTTESLKLIHFRPFKIFSSHRQIKINMASKINYKTVLTLRKQRRSWCVIRFKILAFIY